MELRERQNFQCQIEFLVMSDKEFCAFTKNEIMTIIFNLHKQYEKKNNHLEQHSKIFKYLHHHTNAKEIQIKGIINPNRELQPLCFCILSTK